MSDTHITEVTGGPSAGQAGSGEAGPISHDRSAAIGHALWLMMQSDEHKHLFLADMEWALLPALATGQFKLWSEDGKPTGFASWAYASDEVAARLKAGVKRIKPAEWKGGSEPCVVDVVAPFGGAQEMIKEVLIPQAEGDSSEI